MDRKNIVRNKIRGSLVGGAVGDALGYPVEFWSEERIFNKYGRGGIDHYELDPSSGVAIISDDTQMTLFTASALLFGAYRLRERGICAEPRHYALPAYLGWLHTQQYPYSKENRIPDDWRGWASYLLQDVPEIYARRAPGLTCLRALNRRKEDFENENRVLDYIADRINDSKGCGGVMRVAPMGLIEEYRDMGVLDMEGAQLAAITHSHPLGYTPAAVLVHILNRLVYSELDLKSVILEAKDFVHHLFNEEPYCTELSRIIDLAIALSENQESDLENIHKLGGGWVAEEALAISLYCSLRYKDDFSKAIIASVNHKGDSDSTGAITGNIMGALLGYDAIESKWTETLELHDLILLIADGLYSY